MRKRWLALAGAAAAVSLSVAGWARFLSRDVQLTRARRMPVVDARGESLDIRRANDIKLVFVRDGGQLWAVGASGDKTYLVRFDLVARRGQALWEIEDHRWSLGWSPGPKEQIGYVYKRGDDRAAAGVLGPGGWVVEPVVLPLPNGIPVLRALAWDGTKLEIAMRSQPGGKRIITLEADGTVRHRDVDGVCAKVWQRIGEGADERDCYLRFLAYSRGEWWFSGVGTELRRYRVSETGTVQKSGGPEPEIGTDRVALGVLGDPMSGFSAFRPDGSVAPPAPPPPGLEDEAPWGGTFILEAEGGLRRKLKWYVDHRFVHETPSGLFTIGKREGRASVETPSGARRDVALLESRRDFLESVPFEVEGGTLIVAPSGHYVELDGEGRRLDPLAWDAHLESFHGERRVLRPFYLLWVLLGLPIALLPAGAAVARRAGRRRATKLRAEAHEERWPPARIAAWGCLLYAASAGMALKVLWPMIG